MDFLYKCCTFSIQQESTLEIPLGLGELFAELYMPILVHSTLVCHIHYLIQVNGKGNIGTLDEAHDWKQMFD